MKKIWILFALLVLLTSSLPLYAKLGVGIGTGKIRVDADLKPGIIYELPPLSVVNTGDVDSAYQVSVSYHENQSELKPAKEWIKFEPQKFNLKPGEVQIVKMTIELPLKVVPGEYFAFLEASPIKENEEGSSSVGIAAAAKLYFEVAPANIFIGIYYRLLSLWNLYSPWTERVAGAFALVVLYLVGRNYIKIELKPKKSNESR
ncbi:hypothetical protein HYV12_02815 [Candidatus Dojkabacteria bacterium]|nr:hypothetical protein [Candidatus Dojkabacteria bacterium]